MKHSNSFPNSAFDPTSFPGSLIFASGGGKMRDPGNEVAFDQAQLTLYITHNVPATKSTCITIRPRVNLGHYSDNP